ncbi:pentapeptide repeat-containing protein [Streptomyces sp. NPDC001340]
MIELSGTRDVRRHVQVMPADPAAAAELTSWTAQEDTTLDLSSLDASGVDLSDSDLAMALLTESCLKDAILSGTDLYRAHLERAVLDRADLTHASLVKAVLDGARMRAAVLSEADLGSAELAECDARSASFRRARLNGASFLNTRLEGADLTDASVQETTFDVLLDDHTVLRGLHGTVYGPARIHEKGSPRELAGLELELWLNRHGASVQVLNSPAGAVTYYALISDAYPRSNPEGIVRRRRAGDFTSDEAFTHNLRWEPTEYLRLYELGHNEEDHVEITEDEANQFISRITAKLRGKSPG